MIRKLDPAPHLRLRHPAITDVLLCIGGILLFALAVHTPLPVRATAFILLPVIALVISRHHHLLLGLWQQLSHDFVSGRMVVYNFLALQLGLMGAIYYRYSYNMPVFPTAIGSFLVLALAIAATEEVVFRGYIQTQLEPLLPRLAVLIGALSHAAYKALLFVPGDGIHRTDVRALFLFSLGAYCVLGLLKQYSKSVAPPIITHVVFDLMVYGSYAAAPWWVW